MTTIRRPPVFRHVFVLHNGETIIVPQREAKRVIDRRSDRAPAETRWEVQLPSGLIRPIWLDEIQEWRLEDMEKTGGGSISAVVRDTGRR